MKRFALALALGAALAPAAQAIEYNQVQADKSRIGFGYKQMGVAMDGRFKKFSSQLQFDPAQPANAKATIDVDLASIDTGTAEADSEVAGKPWFNTKDFPTAKFISTSVKALGGNRYEVAGQLTIKGKTQPVVAPTTVTVQGDQATFDGSFVIKRADFAIGEGDWADFSVVANEIQVKFKVLASGGK